MRTLKWIEDAVITRRSQFSTVIVFQTADPKRLPQFLSYVLSQEDVSDVFVFWIWRGLFRATLRQVGQETSIVYEPVRATASSPLVQMIQTTAGASAIRNLAQALNYMDSLFRTKKGVFFIIQGLFQRDDNLIAAVRSWVFDDEIYVRKHTIVIFTENPNALFDDETMKYLIYVKIPPSTEEERREILGALAKAFKLNVELNGLVQATSGLTLHEVESIGLESIARYKTLDYKALTKYKNEIIRKSGILDIEEPSFGFEAVGGYDVVKRFIEDNIIRILKSPEKARKLGLRPPRGILMLGPPGTGKTHFARALAKELKLPFLRLKTEHIVSKWYGETERLMAKALDIAEEVAPCILFIDEIDRFGKRGGIAEHETTRRSFSILLEWLGDERRKTIVLATTNRPEDLDEAFIRVGRFDYLIPFLYPDYKARLEILKVHTSVIRKVPLAQDVSLTRIAEKTELFTGAELEELVLRAARNALKRDAETVSMSDFGNALGSFRIDFNARKEQFERYLRLTELFCNDAQFLETLKRQTLSRIEALKEELKIK
ncbi:hypothetical protein DRJ16_04550 [Candidatus Woesearchaeota archaeon]|nr:MAG: hypothetical protein DRJ16_04550 [Candidatus Woesearchaeota archaeon]